MNKQLQGTVNLPGSKSESNRALMIAAYGGFPLQVENLSEAHDTVLLQTLLENECAMATSNEVVVDCEDAGTVARFMMTYLANKPGEWLLTGTERLCQRPVAPLIDALRQLGADITCIKEHGCLPVRIHGKQIAGGRAELDTSLSSQFASSLLLASPTWKDGLHLVMKGDPVSEPYLAMTIEMMRHFGICVEVKGQTITVASQRYKSCRFSIEADWSAASYWYEMMALSDGGCLLLKGLVPNSIQGDSVVAEWFKPLGVITHFVPEGVRLTKTAAHPEGLFFDFTDAPDLFPAIYATCTALGIETDFKGTSTLSSKESDRLTALQTEMAHMDKTTLFHAYGDHRIAMSLAALWPLWGAVKIDDPSVVNKSYPGFWRDLEML